MESISSVAVEERQAAELFDVLAAVTYLNECRRLADEEAESEALERLKTEEMTQIAEGLDTYLRTEFVYEFDQNKNQVVGFNSVPIASMIDNAIVRTEAMLHKPGLEYLESQLQRYRAEAAEQNLIDAMMSGEVSGNTIITFSPFPFSIQQEYGEDIVRKLDYEPRIKRSMVRIFRREESEDGGWQLRAITLSLDRSNMELMKQLASEFGLTEVEMKTELDFLMRPIVLNSTESPGEIGQELAARYDELRQDMTGEESFHGLPSVESEGRHNSWDLMYMYGDIIERHMRNLDELAKSLETGRPTNQIRMIIGDYVKAVNEGTRFHMLDFSQRSELHGALLDRTLKDSTARLLKELMTYSAWATIKSRLDTGQNHPFTEGNSHLLRKEMIDAGLLQAETGNQMSGCGGVIAFGSREANGLSLLEALFGVRNRIEARYSFNSYMHCVVCQRPPKRDKKGRIERRKWCGPCGICRDCDRKLSA